MWFQKKPEFFIPTKPLNYPSDIAVETELAVYFIKGSSRLRFFSERCLSSWDLILVPGSEASLSKFKKAGVLGFRPGTVVKDISDSKYYIISDNKRRHIVNPDIQEVMGLDLANAIVASSDEIKIHPEGEVLS